MLNRSRPSRASTATTSSSDPSDPSGAVVYLGEGHTPLVEANDSCRRPGRFYFKNDGQNPSASFKDRGMASALSYINYLIDQRAGHLRGPGGVRLHGRHLGGRGPYAAYLQPHVKSAVLLPHKKVTPQQLSQPLGSGARVFEIPGVFDDCMKVVEALSEQYNVALLNSKNAWRILGQESYSYEIAQDLNTTWPNKVVVVPIGNAGNITAVMNGFLKFLDAGIIRSAQNHRGPVRACRPGLPYYLEPDPANKRRIRPMTSGPAWPRRP
jgi:threonine synthase